MSKALLLAFMALIMPVLAACGLFDSGMKLSEMLVGESEITVVRLSPNFDEDSVMFAGTTHQGVFRSDDRGKRWVAANGDIEELAVVDLAMSPNFADDGLVFAGSFDGLYKSSDRGATWEHFEDTPFGWVASIAISPDYESDDVLMLIAMDKRSAPRTHFGFREMAVFPGRNSETPASQNSYRVVRL